MHRKERERREASLILELLSRGCREGTALSFWLELYNRATNICRVKLSYPEFTRSFQLQFVGSNQL